MVLVVLQQESSYGYEIMERLTMEFGFEQINPGTIYRTLRQMEKEGLCESEWETSGGGGGGGGGPARRMYHITGAGEKYLDAWVQACKGYRRVMDALCRAYLSRTTHRSPEHGEDDEVSA